MVSACFLEDVAICSHPQSNTKTKKKSQGTKLCGIRQSVASSRGSGKLNKWDSVDKSKKYPVAVAYNSQLSFKSQSTLVVSYNVSYLFKEI